MLIKHIREQNKIWNLNKKKLGTSEHTINRNYNISSTFRPCVSLALYKQADPLAGKTKGLNSPNN